MKLFLGSISNLPKFTKKIDKVLDVNSFQFWSDPLNSLIDVRKCMNKGGTIAVVHQPRKPGSTALDAMEAGNKISSLLKEAGFKNIVIHKKNMKPVATICVMGNA
jgi:hypothetical protein